MSKKIFITAGELSGDLNASLLVDAVCEKDAAVEFVGVGGPKMKAAGVRLLADSTTWGSIGILEGAARFFSVYPTLRRMGAYFKQEKPDLYIPVDYRFFSMKCAAVAKRAGIKVVYYFAPVSWFGTGGKRFEMMKNMVDLALVALPFSLDQYKKAGIPYEYIGHPIIDAAIPTMSKKESASYFGFNTYRPIVGLMPGSRFQEVGRLTPVFRDAVNMMRAGNPRIQFALFRASDAMGPLIEKRLGGAPVRIIDEKVYDFMKMCDVLILCSGTATHEAALVGTPMIIAYKVSPLTAWLIRRTVDPPMIGMPNIIYGEKVIPELVQEDCTAVNVASQTIEMLSDENIRYRITEILDIVRERLGEPGVAARAADSVLNMLYGSEETA